MAEIVMPRLSDTMEEGTILRWLKADGEEVARGEELVEIETDKANMTYESDQAGVLQILAQEGETLAVGALIAHVGAATGAAAQPAAAPAAPAAQVQAAAPTDAAEPTRAAPTAGARSGDGAPAAPAPATATSAGEDANGGSADGAGRVKASPLARRLARERGIDLRRLLGSGPGGRIVKADVEASVSGAAGTATAPAPAAVAGPGPEPTAETPPTQAGVLEGVATAKGETTSVELSRTQQAIARRMAESKATIPDFSVRIEVDMEECVRLRTELKALAAPNGPAGPAGHRPEVPTYNDMVVKASALALREHPVVNGSYRDGRVQLHSRVNVGVAVAAERSLVVPTIFDADEKSLGEIAREARALAERVRDGTITPPELGGGTFTVSNLGMFGVSDFTPIINPPQVAILAVGALARRPVVREDQLVAASMLALTLVCDHRVLYGADAAQFCARVRELLQAPAALTL
jgi:pyruvate dehydrogenase E2 component (dihydrolipoamide acetyltransferase)